MIWMTLADTGTPLPPEDEGDKPRTPRAPTAREEAFDALTDVMPWAVSFVLHLGLILIALFVAWATVQQLPDDETIIIPDTNWSPTPGQPIQVQAQQSTDQSAAAASMTDTVRSTAAAQGALGFTGAPGSSSTAGLSAGLTGTGQSLMSQSTGADQQFQTRLFGVGGNARRVIFLIDASGSLIDTLPFVIDELKRSVGRLKPQQQFTVIFFQGSEAIEVPPRGWKQVNDQTKQRVISWIDMGSGNIIPQGLSSPVTGLELALRYQPDLIILLSDNITGQGPYEVDQRRLLADIHRHNTRRTKISTIQFLYPDRLADVSLPLGLLKDEVYLRPTMELIAEQTGGRYKFLDARELEIE